MNNPGRVSGYNSSSQGSRRRTSRVSLFDDVLRAKKAREEHDAFAAGDARQGRQGAHLVGDLLADGCPVNDGRAFAPSHSRLRTDYFIGPSLVKLVRQFLNDLQR